MTAVKYTLSLILVAAVVAFAFMNQQEVDIAYYFGRTYHTRLWAVAVIAALAGAAVAALFAGISILRLKGQLWSAHRKAEKLDEELSRLRNQAAGMALGGQPGSGGPAI